MKNHRLTAFAVAAALSLTSVTIASAGTVGAAVPEPGTFALIGTGVAALAAGAWWRNRK
jgi:hypothetical protein